MVGWDDFRCSCDSGVEEERDAAEAVDVVGSDIVVGLSGFFDDEGFVGMGTRGRWCDWRCGSSLAVAASSLYSRCMRWLWRMCTRGEKNVRTRARNQGDVV